MKKIIALLVIACTTLTSCNVDSDNVSQVTNYPNFDILGDNPMFVPQGNTYTDPGVIVTEAGTVIPHTTNIFGNFKNETNVNTQISDEYDVVYTAKNKDGFYGSKTRKVIVYKTGDLVNSIEGVYTCTVSRNGITPDEDAYKNIEFIHIWKNTDGTYEVSDAFGGWYQYGKGYGLGYITPGGKINAVDIANNSFTFPGGPLSNGGFGGTATITGLTVDPITKTIVLNCSWQADAITSFAFVSTLTQVQL